jgi:DNA-binding NarL/FixJ family response regulator
VVHPAVLQMAEQHIDGFISKTMKPDELKQRIEALFGHSSKPSTDSDTEELSEREIEVIRLCTKGLTASEIGDKLHIGKRTVETHKERIFLKLGLKSTKELINYAFRHGLTE